MNKPVRILHLEDVQSDADIVRREIARSGILFEWCLVSSKNEFEQALTEFSPDIILSDHTLLHFSSMEALKIIRDWKLKIPFILVTATVSEEFAVSMIKDGVADYLLKDRLQRLPSAVISAIEKWKGAREKEEQLAEIIHNESNLHAIMENSDVSIYSLDINLCYITFNTLYENSVKDLCGLQIRRGDSILNFLQELNPDDAHEWGRVYAEALSGKSLRLEREFKKGSRSVYTSFSINPIWESASMIGLACFARDITEQKLAQEKLRQSEERYRNIVETAQEGIWITGENEQTSFVNKKLCEIFEYSSEEMLGKQLHQLMAEEDRLMAADKIKLRERGTSEAFDFKFITKNGKTVWTNLTNSPLFDGQGNYVGALAMVTDITRKKLDEESLKKSEANIRSIFENTDVAYVLSDPELLVVSFNQVADVMYKKELGKPLQKGSNLQEYFTGEKKIDLEKKYKKALRGSRVNYETHFTSANNAAWYNIQLSPVFDIARKILGLVIAMTDITDRKELELQREKITSDLLQRNKDLEQFTYIVSHNLRAPVANILGISNVLNVSNLSFAEKAELEKGISSSAKKLDTVIVDLNNILQVKRDIHEKKELVSFSELLQDIKTSVVNLIDMEKLTIRTSFDEVNELLTLKSYLYSIFYNLLSNSIKYRRIDVDPVIEISSHRKRKNKIVLLFKDNGIGIDLEKHGEKIFGLYKRFHTLETEGKGMGLFMVKTQVETLGGKISVTSEVNKGTVFKIEFEL